MEIPVPAGGQCVLYLTVFQNVNERDVSQQKTVVYKRHKDFIWVLIYSMFWHMNGDLQGKESSTVIKGVLIGVLPLHWALPAVLVLTSLFNGALWLAKYKSWLVQNNVIDFKTVKQQWNASGHVQKISTYIRNNQTQNTC
jgi:hypothetical protein